MTSTQLFLILFPLALFRHCSTIETFIRKFPTHFPSIQLLESIGVGTRRVINVTVDRWVDFGSDKKFPHFLSTSTTQQSERRQHNADG